MGSKPYAAGFRLDGPVQSGDVSSMLAAAVNIAKGDMLVDDGSGFLTNAGITAFVDGAMYIAIEDCSNSGGAAGDLSVLCIPINLSKNSWWARNESATVAAATDRGEVVDLESEDGIDVTDVTLVAYGFMIEEIDISAAAVAACTGGYVRGRFIVVGETT